MKRSKPFARLQWQGRSEAEPPPASLSKVCQITPPGVKPADTSLSERLILGENAGVMAGMLPEYENKLDLIYADPPFLSGKAYAARVGRNEDSRKPSEWNTVEGYRDTWPDGAAYLDMLYPRLKLMHKLLSPSGTLYLHLDWHASAYARLMLDEIFGPTRLLNEIIWTYHGPSPIRSAFKRKHDTILVYTKTNRYTFNADAVRVAYDPSTVKAFASSDKAGFGKKPDLARGKVPEDWWYFPVIARLHSERTGYPTQKPEALLARILLASSNTGDLIFDPFCGSGTTLAVAGRLGRRWIGCDANPLAVHTSYRRLLLSEEPQLFSLWEAGSPEGDGELRPKITTRVSGSSIAVQLVGASGAVKTPAAFPENIVLWEVDWDYDGKLFRSRSQSVRAWQGQHLDLELSRDQIVKGNPRIGVRAIDAVGNSGIASQTIRVQE